MTTTFFVVLVALFGTAYSSCTLGIQTDDVTKEVTLCKNECCDEYCCFDDKTWSDLSADIGGAVTTALTTTWIVVIVILSVIAIAIIVSIVTCCYCYWRKNQQPGFVIPPQPACVSVHNMNPMHHGYDQAPSRSPPRYADKQNVV